LVNLILNAVDAMPAGGTLTLRSRTMTEPGVEHTGSEFPPRARVRVEVCDTGVGMSEETRRKCLEPFFTTKGEGGTGLGLAMVYGMVQRHQADIEIESELRQGTTFRLVFPAADTAMQPAASQAVARRPTQSLRILLVDDDARMRNSLRKVLEADGHRVTVADGGQAGIDTFIAAAARGEPFSIVLADIGMPYVDGRKVAAAIKAASPQTPIALVTGWGQSMRADDVLPSHVDRLLGKPPDITELRGALAELTAQRK